MYTWPAGRASGVGYRAAMGHIEPTAAQLEQLAALPQDAAVVMLNLVRYRSTCPDDSVAAGMTGEEAYAEYGRRVAALEPPFAGVMETVAPVEATVVGPDDESWDLMVLVRYPTVASFLGAISRPDYEEAGQWRTAALSDSRLIATASPPAG